MQGLLSLEISAKAAVTEHLCSAIVPPQYREEFDRITDFMNRGASTDGFMTRMKIKDLDQKRNQGFAVVSPEMAELIQYKKNV